MPAATKYPNVIQVNDYIGRFAPSPSGPLHFGSLVAALGSYLQARKSAGKWLLRIEDIDPPREVNGATEQILKTLELHHLYWDDEPVYQSQRYELYDRKIAQLSQQNLTFYCGCTRAQLAATNAQQLCPCANLRTPLKNAAIRFNNQNCPVFFNDVVQGQVDLAEYDSEMQFTIKRKDGLYAYQLAVVVDDIAQGITEVVRGADLISATFYQLALYQAFGISPPSYAHLPVVLGSSGKKLSKQNYAVALDNSKAVQNIFQALSFLGLPPPSDMEHAQIDELMVWAISQWNINKVPAKLACNDNRISRP